MTAAPDAGASVVHLIDANADTHYFRSIAAHTDRHRFRVSIGSLADQGPLQSAMRDAGVGTFSLEAHHPARSRYPLAAARLAHLLRETQADLLHAHCFYPTAIGLLAARFARTRFLFTRHHSDHNIRLGKRWHTRIDALCAKRADAVIAVSEATADVMIRIEGVPRQRIRVVYNGIDPLPESHTTDETLRGALGLSAEQRVCLMVGRLHEEKGQYVLFEAWPRVARQHPATLLLVVGEGPHKEQMMAAAAERRLGSAVRFLGPRKDVPALMNLASLVVVPSLAESFGFVALEAMSMGRPVVAAATGGLPELVVDDVTGVLVPKGDAPALGDAIAAVLSAPDRAASLGQAARERSRCFTAESMVRGYESVYGELLGR